MSKKRRVETLKSRGIGSYGRRRRGAFESNTGGQQRRNKKGMRDVQVCDTDQSLGDILRGKKRKKGGEKRKHTHAHFTTEEVKPVKRKDNDQRSNEMMEEARGRHTEE